MTHPARWLFEDYGVFLWWKTGIEGQRDSNSEMQDAGTASV